ncbi:hypothetical protein Mgra_00007228 [Meloidogyne graminicola]|uniref:Syndecan n=1 Tax=Meloidogyne graminicola TaxID=189291 RepID=A0A8S9ZJ20_9BILA|nr:hypothetical protein Mgra_00007228 [Meloidogyne graminicola]
MFKCLASNQNAPTFTTNQIDSKLNDVEPLSIPKEIDTFEGSGVNPDDEDGDVEEGSGDDIEGSGSPPSDDNVRMTTQAEDDFEEVYLLCSKILLPLIISYKLKGSTEKIDTFNSKNTQINVFIDNTSSAIQTFKPETTIKIEQPPPSGPKTDITNQSTSTTIKTSTTNIKEIKSKNATITGKSDKERFPPEFVPPITTTTKRPTTIKTTLRTTIPTTKSTKLPKQKMPPPPFIVDPTGTLEQLKPGVFALIVGGAVVFILLMILIITYIFYRIRKKDEGSYICEDHVQTHRYSNYYQKASTKEFYA